MRLTANKGNDREDRKVVSRCMYPSQSLEGVAEIRKAGVTFPIELKIFFGVRIGLQQFK